MSPLGSLEKNTRDFSRSLASGRDFSDSKRCLQPVRQWQCLLSLPVGRLVRVAFDLSLWTCMFLSKAKLLKLIRKTWTLRSTCFACLQPGRASCPLPELPCSVYPTGDPNQWVHMATTTVSLEWVGAVVFVYILVPRLRSASFESTP